MLIALTAFAVQLATEYAPLLQELFRFPEIYFYAISGESKPQNWVEGFA